MPGQWDDLMKILVGANPQHFVSFLLAGARFQHERSQELKSRTIVADLLYTVIWKRKRMVLHVEFQRRRDRHMGRRLWEYNVLTMYTSRLPVCSFVIYLKKDGNVVTSPYMCKLPNGEVVHVFHFRIIKLWEISTEVLKQAGLEGMLPLLTLTKDGARHEVVEEMITGLHAAGKSDLLPLGYAFTALVFDNEADRDWLKRRFAVLRDVLEESWAYQEMKQQGLTEGLEKGKREALGRTLMSFVQKRFPDVVPLAEKHIAVTKDPEVLQHIIDELFAVQTTEEARHVLSVSLKRKKKTASK